MFENKTPEEAKALLDSGEWTYVDVRTVEEFDAGHPPGAWNVPFAVRQPPLPQLQPNPDFMSVMRTHFQPGQKLVLGCAVGGRSMYACQALAMEGYAHLVNMDGGFSSRRDQTGNVVQVGWQESGYAVETETPAERTYEELRGENS